MASERTRSIKVRTMPPEVWEYAFDHSTEPDPLLEELTDVTAARFPARIRMQAGPVVGGVLGLLTAFGGAQRVIEVGTFTGYSSLCIARALPPGGNLLCCDVSEEWTSVAREFWARDGVSDRIELKIAPALDTIGALPARPAFDLAFIDADKAGYPAYYEALLPRMRRGGLFVFDNTLRGGQVLDPAGSDEGTLVIASFNAALARDARVQVVLLPVSDGLTLARVL
jgi:caffeoyl-CoA O-methyltransferase